MADLELLCPDAIPTARRELDALATIDSELAGLRPDQLRAPIETRRKARAADVLPEDGSLPVKMADVIAYEAGGKTSCWPNAAIAGSGGLTHCARTLARPPSSPCCSSMRPVWATAWGRNAQRCCYWIGSHGSM
jgi:hypothetical protein